MVAAVPLASSEGPGGLVQVCRNQLGAPLCAVRGLPSPGQEHLSRGGVFKPVVIPAKHRPIGEGVGSRVVSFD